MERDNQERQCVCACCGHFTISEIKETCPICFWEEDSYQEEHIDDDSGPNNTSLRRSQENYKKYGVMDLEFKKYVRPPLKEELEALSGAELGSMIE